MMLNATHLHPVTNWDAPSGTMSGHDVLYATVAKGETHGITSCSEILKECLCSKHFYILVAPHLWKEIDQKSNTWASMLNCEHRTWVPACHTMPYHAIPCHTMQHRPTCMPYQSADTSTNRFRLLDSSPLTVMGRHLEAWATFWIFLQLSTKGIVFYEIIGWQKRSIGLGHWESRNK